mmetsp:Transcript_34539/g.63751  ORF Transcript_34539/g.63751 Transcript_34539/m.63751 type:complete len:297 (+) Transcript_34539:91-981(+)|eukprot:CAMPEP_0196137814 /NCGR_PEP_ID=MMETSP0910-20130528/5673_1 /TAXON_ID=49265 /ORGANISM="Thalassiosira rotula, Strain GSO102" /LENGTH=296 /DNA_ID=CAMNT_0041398327 /DNA_START=52 /DNA_END=942 /DNA_ORIENTATION=-
MPITIVPSPRLNPKGLLLVHIIVIIAMNSMVYRPINAFALLSQQYYSRRLLFLSSSSQRRHNQNIIRQNIYSSSASKIRNPKNTHNNNHHRLNSASSSSSSNINNYSINLSIPTPEDMEDIGGLLSIDSTKGDVILLDGDLGAGKTCFSRGFIRGRTGSEDERVTSPTYLLSNTYVVDGGCTKIYHMDLYRLSGSKGDDDLAPLDLENVFGNEISLVEWPERLGSRKPRERLDITLSIDSSTAVQNDDDDGDDGDDSKLRCMKLVPYGDRWVERLNFLESEGYFEDLIMDSSTIDE